jgi:catechol 2,3-dioxygenase-like lactoylglutathione lyase family enzyme
MVDATDLRDDRPGGVGQKEAAMAKIRHIAIFTEDPEKTADWYKEVFELVEVGRAPRGGIYLSDGVVNFAVLRVRPPDSPKGSGLGLDHFGFIVEDAEATCRKLDAMGARRLPDFPIGDQYFEIKYEGPDGVVVDIGAHGWVGARPLHADEPVAAATQE